MAETFICAVCKKMLPRTAEFFYRFKNNKDGLRTQCKDCHNSATTAYAEANKDKLAEMSKDRYWANRERFLNINKAYCQENKGRLGRVRSKYQCKRRRIDEGFRQLTSCRSLLSSGIRCGYTDRATKTTALVGCNSETLRAHIESLFTEGMTWHDFMSGAIHIDHIRPCCLFDLSKEEDRNTCFHYTNLQPLWAEDNRAKRMRDVAELRAA